MWTNQMLIYIAIFYGRESGMAVVPIMMMKMMMMTMMRVKQKEQCKPLIIVTFYSQAKLVKVGWLNEINFRQIC